MLVPLKWMNDFIKIDDINPVEFADAMTMSGSKVEEVKESGKEISNVLTGKILKIEKHPDADKLLVCSVDTGLDTIQIVTGANNIKEGDVVPVAIIGATLPGGVKIKKGKLRGIESSGMLCSAVELGMDVQDAVHGIYILPESTAAGLDVKEALGLNNVIVDFEITSNRPDCLSMIGMAREASATFGRELHIPKIIVKENKEDINQLIKVEIKDKELCRRYAARIVKDVKIGDSPEWMKERLTEAGVRPVNNIVDITNYVMIEYGQPLHAFDYEEIEGKKIIVRRAKNNEKMVTLDGKERSLNSSMLVIANTEGPMAVAGVMGGFTSEVTEKTRTILLESANFNGTSVRLTSKELGFRTEASSRFEKGIDPNIAVEALNRAAGLVNELGAGEVVGGIVDSYEDRLEPWIIDICPERINRFLGISLAEEDMIKILDKLDVKVLGKDPLKAVIPTFRSDLELEADIAEEIARIYGYNNIESTAILGETLQGGRNEKQMIEDKVKDILVGSGAFEIATYSFISNNDLDKIKVPEDSNLRNAIKILNPIGEELSIMRTTLIPSMLDVISTNYNRKTESAEFFEIGRVYWPADDSKAKLPEEKNILILGMYGARDYYDIKGTIELLFQSLGIRKYEFIRETENTSFHPGKTAKILIKKKTIGTIGEVHPDIIEKYDIHANTFICELDFDEIVANCELEKQFKQLPKYPAIERDMALLLSKDVMASQIETIIRQKGGSLIENIKLFDIYEGKQIPEGKKSIAYSIVYRAQDRTLKDEEVNEIHNLITSAIESKLGAQLRL